MNWRSFLALIDRHRLIYGVVAALLIAMLLTAISMALYVSSGASRLDLSRPGYEGAREAAQRDASDDSFSSTGPLNTDVAKDFQERFNKQRTQLSKLGNYGTNALDDDQLQIAPSPDTTQ